MVIDGISYIPSSVLLTGIPKLTFKDNRAFGVFDPRGEAPRSYSTGSELGLYYNDTRYIGTWETTFNGMSPVALAHELRYSGNCLVISMTNRDIPILGSSEGRIPRDTFLIRKIMAFHEDTLYQTLIIRNFDQQAHVLQVESWAGSRFEDVFEVRGFPRANRGRILPVQEKTLDGLKTILLQYEGLDGRVRTSHIQHLFETEKIRMSPTLVGHFTRVEVPPKGDAFLQTIVAFEESKGGKLSGRRFDHMSVPETLEVFSGKQLGCSFSGLQIETDHAIINRAVQNARIDIQMLLTQEEEGYTYPYAGIPWFSAPFGRDGLICAYQLLPWHPEVARGVLGYALQTLGTQVDDFTDEQPGKVFHEMRRGEMSNTREVPFIPYFGSVDSTPLALILLHEYVRWTLDLDRLKAWWPSALRALEWIEKWGDPSGDGFIQYSKQSPTGLVNQGWKDSHDSIMHSNGTLAVAPIRLCEAQGYAFRARMAMSELARLIGDNELSGKLRLDALELRARFTEQFWDPKRNSVHLALDAELKPCAVLSSNMGHCLWSQILDSGQAESVTRHLMSSSMFSGYGIRTLADSEVAYNPLSYHNGSVWPHDNSLIMEGMRNYGHVASLEKLSLAMINVLESSNDFRLPELFCGFRRRGNEPPIPYEVACKPQAWAAGSVFLMLKSMLGMSMDADQSYLVFRSPILTEKAKWLEIKNLRGRDWEIDVAIRRARGATQVEVTRRVGRVRVLTVR